MFATPKAQRKLPRSYTQKEKDQILENFDLELNSRIRTIEAELEAHLSKLLIFSKNQITRVPANVRDITLREFGEKSQGDMNVLVRGMATVNTIRKDPAPPTAGKRKRDDTAENGEDPNPRPTKAPPQRSAKGTPQRPTKATPQRQVGETAQRHQFPHTSATFSPSLRHNTPLPIYPRPMRHDEFLLSKNGSPVANPFAGERTRANSVVVLPAPVDPSSTKSQSSRDLNVASATVNTSKSRTRSSGSGTWLQLHTQSGHTVAFDPAQTAPQDIESREDLSESEKREIAEQMSKLTEAFHTLRWDRPSS
ncbi:hypothetical protein BS47DRAFT_1342529 [Hydnum rufescens UP504]|uniref:Borealin N-terminal domain-containing protein n=1 Tax=Hydnum rufescens UP504 TaxID=1448309 RepID=A0A9P6B0U4_9AGAM|nr:hypothetical protein BS47DRAFT_1342529 [Hydnum rufescens UP504]